MNRTSSTALDMRQPPTHRAVVPVSAIQQVTRLVVQRGFQRRRKGVGVVCDHDERLCAAAAAALLCPCCSRASVALSSRNLSGDAALGGDRWGYRSRRRRCGVEGRGGGGLCGPRRSRRWGRGS